ncbi:MAG: anthranilate synthase component I family protein [Pseudanabaenaceae cyanobacterium bins.68]|nr:anthranilate synthase component I family protein [Pseudanabaenaceae cyanobacterium bins.68]
MNFVDPTDNYPEFLKLSEQGNFIPLYRELMADLDTPVSAWYRVCQGQPYSFLLESVEGGDRLGRYSLLGCDPLWRLEAKGDRAVQTFRDGSNQEFQGNPFEILGDCLSPILPVKLAQLPPSLAGLVGFWGYELIHWVEPTVPIYPAGSTDIPDGLWMQIDQLLVFDQVKRKIWAIAYGNLLANPDPAIAYAKAHQQLDTLVDKLRQPLDRSRTAISWIPGRGILEFRSNVSEADFCAKVAQAKAHITAGDIFQVVISQKLTTPYPGDPFNLYRSLRQINPSPYMAYLHFDHWQLIGSSPEIMVKAEGEPLVAVVRPIAGTRPRGNTELEDQQLAAELLADPKEVAEHVMLVDLGRNDLGRVCDRVQVDQFMQIERYSHVMHIVSNVVGELAKAQNPWQLLKACFPAGTVSGAPKIRAMQIIHALEGERRGAYAGAYGYYDFEGQLNTAITIRTAIVRDGKATVQAGAGLVADSDPATEYQETLNKMKGMLEAVGCLQ